MSGIVGSRVNIRGSGLVGSLGTDGQVFTSSGAGTSATYEAAGGFGVSSITGATALTTEPATTDEMVLSDAGTLKRLDMKHVQNVPFISLGASSDQTISAGTLTRVVWGTVDKSVEGTWDSDNNRWTPGVAGCYWVIVQVRYGSEAMVDGKHNGVKVMLNGGQQSVGTVLYTRGDSGVGWNSGYQWAVTTANTLDLRRPLFLYMDDDDYIDCSAYHNATADASTDASFSSWVMWRITGSGVDVDSSRPWPSDIRLKEDIELVGKSPTDINIYSFKYKNKDGRYEGVMAHEVPWASVIDNKGYLKVDYSKIDVNFKKLEGKV